MKLIAIMMMVFVLGTVSAYACGDKSETSLYLDGIDENQGMAAEDPVESTTSEDRPVEFSFAESIKNFFAAVSSVFS